jgi:hypothetical protein
VVTMNRRLQIAAAMLLVSSPVLATEPTLARYIVELNVDGETNTHYFRGSGGASGTPIAWGIAGCSGAMYVYTRDLSGQKDVLAAALSAATSGRSVVFYGTCDADGMYFHATRVIATF